MRGGSAPAALIFAISGCRARKVSSLMERSWPLINSELVARMLRDSSFRFTPPIVATSLMSSSSLRIRTLYHCRLAWTHPSEKLFRPEKGEEENFDMKTYLKLFAFGPSFVCGQGDPLKRHALKRKHWVSFFIPDKVFFTFSHFEEMNDSVCPQHLCWCWGKECL